MVIDLERNAFHGGGSAVALDNNTGKVSLPTKGRIGLPNRRLSMRKIKDVLRLRYELGLGQRQIARSCAIAQATVADYLKRAEAAGIGWPPPPDWDEARLERAVFGAPAPQPPKTGKALPDMAAVREQLQRHRDLTLQLIWEEYR